VRTLLLGNLGTKAMALLLAVLTWSYLYTQGVGTKDIEFEFLPAPLDPEVFASVTYSAGGRTLAPGAQVTVRVTGPKFDVGNHALRTHKFFKVDVRVDAKDLPQPQGTYTVSLTRDNYTIPGQDISFEPLFGSQIKVDYVRYREKPLELVATPFDTQGRPKVGFKIESITPIPPKVLAWVPADIADQVDRVRIRPVPVEDKEVSFTADGDIEPAARARNIKPRDAFRVDVKIVSTPSTRAFTADLLVNATPEVLRKVKLETPSVKIQLQGPEDLLREAPDAAFRPYVLVTAGDVATPGPKLIKEAALGCHIDAKYQGKIRVVLMPDDRPENREVKITVQ
jgi:hypothetical protein